MTLQLYTTKMRNYCYLIFTLEQKIASVGQLYSEHVWSFTVVRSDRCRGTFQVNWLLVAITSLWILTHAT